MHTLLRDPLLIYPVVERLSRAGILFVTGVVLARALGPEVYGHYSSAFALYSLVAAFTTLGMAGTLSHASASGAERGLLWNVVLMRAATTILICSLILPFVAEFFGLDSSVYWVIVIALLVFSLESADHYLQGRQQFKILLVAKTGAVIVACVTSIAWAMSGRPLGWILAARLSEWAIAVMLLAALGVFAGAQSRNWAKDFESARKLATKSAPLMISTISAAIYLKIDILMLSKLSTANEVAQYSVAAQVSEAWYLIPTALGAYLLPLLTKIRAIDRERYSRELQTWSNVLVYSAIFIASVICLAAQPIISTIFGSNYSPAAAILRIHVWAGVFVFFRALVSKWIIIEDLISISLKTQLLGATANVVLNWLLIPSFAGTGAAVATLISYGLASYLGLRIWSSSRPAALVFEKSIMYPFISFYKWASPRQ